MLMDIQQAGFRVLPGEGEKLSVAMPLDMLRQVIFKITAGKNTIQGQRLFVRSARQIVLLRITRQQQTN